jgi:hypothetical protein
VAGKVLERAQNAVAVECVEYFQRVTCDDGRVGRKTALESANHGILRIEIEVYDGREIQINAQVGQQRGDLLRVLSREGQVVGRSQILRGCRCRESGAFFQARDPTTLLINADQQRDRREVLDLSRQRANLARRLNVARVT